MFSGTRGTVTAAAAVVGGAYLAIFTVAWVLPASSVLHRSSGVTPVRRALLADGPGSGGKGLSGGGGGAIAKLWAQGTGAAKRPAYWLPSELGVHHYSIAGGLPTPVLDTRSFAGCLGATSWCHNLPWKSLRRVCGLDGIRLRLCL